MFTVNRPGKRKSSTGGTATAPAGWYSSDKTVNKTGRQPLQFQQLLVLPGELGSEIATVRNSSKERASTNNSNINTTQNKKRKHDGTLTAFMVPKAASRRAASNAKQQRITRTDVKGKGRLAEAQRNTTDSETEDSSDNDEEQPDISLRSDKSEYISVIGDNDSFRLPPMPTPLPPSSLALPIAVPAIPAVQTVFGFGAAPKHPSLPLTRIAKIPSAKKRRVIQTSSPPPPVQSTPATSRRKERVLVDPSSELSPVSSQERGKQGKEDPYKEDEGAWRLSSTSRRKRKGRIANPDQTRKDKETLPSSNNTRSHDNDKQHKSTKKNKASADKRSGSRVPWDSDDESERIRLNLLPSTSQIINSQARISRKRRGIPSPVARNPPFVIMETTNYMDKFREESYSPVQYTMTESLRDGFLGRLGVSPLGKRREKEAERWRAPGVRKQNEETDENAADSEMEKTLEEHQSLVAVQKQSQRQQEVYDESPYFDESATERTMPSQRPSGPPTTAAHDQTTLIPTKSAIADDSGCFVVPSSSSSPSQYVLAPETDPTDLDVGPEEVVEASILPPTAKAFKTQLVSETEISQPETILPEDEVMQSVQEQEEEEEETVPSSQHLADHQQDEDEEMMAVESFFPIPAKSTNKVFTARVLQSQLLDYPETMQVQEESVEDSQDEGGDDCFGNLEAEDLGPDLDNSQDEEEEEQVPDSQDEFEEDDGEIESALLQRQEPRILVEDTQVLMDLETQDIQAGETQFSGDVAVDNNDDDEEIIACSQDEEEVEGEELGLSLGKNDADPATNTASMKAAKRRSNNNKNIEQSISAAWFTNVLSPKTAASSSKANKEGGEQTSLTRFFALKPGGAAERVARETEEREKMFSAQVGRQVQQARRVSFDVPALAGGSTAQEEGEDAIEDEEAERIMQGETQFVPSSQTQLDKCDFQDWMQDDEEHEEGTQQVSDSDSDNDDEDELDSAIEQGKVSLHSCELWVSGRSSQVPSPIKRARLYT